MATTQTGKVAQFGTKGYGFIEDSAKNRYFVHQKNVYNKSRLRVGTPVVFEVEKSEKGLVAKNVQLADAKGTTVSIKAKRNTRNNTNNVSTLKTMLMISYIIHAILIYAVFIK